MNDAAAQDRARTAKSHHQDAIDVDRHFHRVPTDARERDRDQDVGIGFDELVAWMVENASCDG